MLKITTLPEAWGEQVRPAPRPPNRQARFPPPLVQGLAATILQFAPLKMVPDSLGRIKLRRVAGQLFQVQAGRRSRGEEVIHGLRVVDVRPIPDDQELARNLAEQLPQEAHYRRAAEGVVVNVREQPSLRCLPADHRIGSRGSAVPAAPAYVRTEHMSALRTAADRSPTHPRKRYSAPSV